MKAMRGDKIMSKSNKELVLSWSEVIEILKEINVILISLHYIGSYYADKLNIKEYEREYEKENTRFIDECRVTGRLAKVRYILGKNLDIAQYEDMEQSMEDLTYWEKPGDNLEEFCELD